MTKKDKTELKDLIETFVDNLEGHFNGPIEGIEIKLEHPNRGDDTKYADVKEVNIYYLNKVNIWNDTKR